MKDAIKGLREFAWPLVLVAALLGTLLSGCQMFSQSDSPSKNDAAVAKRLNQTLHAGMSRQQALAALGLDPETPNTGVPVPSGMQSESFNVPAYPGYWITLDESVSPEHAIQVRAWHSYRNTNPPRQRE